MLIIFHTTLSVDSTLTNDISPILMAGYGQGYGGGGASYSAPSGGAYGQQAGYSQSMGTNENFGAMGAQVR